MQHLARRIQSGFEPRGILARLRQIGLGHGELALRCSTGIARARKLLARDRAARNQRLAARKVEPCPGEIGCGDADQRLDYQSSLDFVEYAKSVGVDVTLETFANADHTEGMLTETDRYAAALKDFFDENLTK